MDLRGVKLEGADRDGATLKVPWHIWAGLFSLLAAAVFSVWLSTRDVATELRALSASVDRLAYELDKGQDERHALDRRVTVLEARGG